MKYKKRIVASLMALVLLGWWQWSVQAHAVPVLTSPAANEIFTDAPTEVSIQFNETVVLELSQIVILTQAGQVVETGPLRYGDGTDLTLIVDLPPLNDGAYLVSWQVLSGVDGHTTAGSFSFGVGVAEITAVSDDVTVTAQLSALSAIARWLNLTGIALLIGFFGFRLLVWNPIWRDVTLAAAEEAVDIQLARYGLRITTVALVLLGVGLVLTFIDQSQSFQLLQGSNLQTWLSTRFGAVWLARLILLLVLQFYLSLFINGFADRSELGGWQWWGGLWLTVGLAATVSLISHSAALQEETLQSMAIDFGHVLAAALWTGGLLFFALAAWLVRHIDADLRSWLVLSLILNFSGLAAIAVGLLLISGGLLAATHVGTWTALVGTLYGRALLGKIGLMLPLLLIAGINLLHIKPTLDAVYQAEEREKATAILQRFNRLVRLEAVLGLVILLAAGILTDLQRGVDAPLLTDAPGETIVTQTSEDLEVEMTIQPALIGPNQFDLLVLDEQGEPVTDAREVEIRYTFLEQSLGSATAVATPVGNGHYLVEGSYISLSGAWQLEVTVRRDNLFDVFVPYRLDAGIGGNIRSQDSSARPLESFAQFMTLAGGGGTGIGIVLFALVWGFVATKAAKTEWQLIPLLLITVLAIWFGAAQVLDFFTNEYTPAKFATNPILPDGASIEIGQTHFNENCVPCHGEAGRGDGPSAASLVPPPADFTDGHTAIHTDGDLFFWIKEGVEGTAMPAFGDQFTDDEVWHLVNYVRRLSNS